MGNPAMSDPNADNSAKSDDFASRAEAGQSSQLGAFWSFLRHNKKWWLLPIILMLLVFGAVLIVGGTAAAPFIYTLF